MNNSELKKYLAMISQGMASKKRQWKYNTAYEFVLKEGREFPVIKKVESLGLPMGKIKACFGNSLEACLFDSSLRYVEGYAFSIALPVEHAWCIDSEDQVIDLTWRKPGSAYIGVEFPINYVRRIVAKSGEYGVINKWKLGWPLLTGEHDYQEIKKGRCADIYG